jgi:hypothetical protein
VTTSYAYQRQDPFGGSREIEIRVRQPARAFLASL